MNPVYAIMESRHRWLILAGLSFGAGCFGAMAMLADGWSHTLARVWLYAGLLVAIYFVVRAVLDWNSRLE